LTSTSEDATLCSYTIRIYILVEDTMFKKKKVIEEQPLRAEPLAWPGGMVVRTEKNTWYIKNGKRYKFASDRVLQSWRVDVVVAWESSLSGIKQGGTLGFRDGTLIQDISSGKIYLISDNKRRHIVSPDVFTVYSLDRNRVIECSSVECNLHIEGEELSAV